MSSKGIINEILQCKDKKMLDIHIEELSDKFQHGIYDSKELCEIVQFLIRYCMEVTDEFIRESILNAVTHSLNNSDIGSKLDFSNVIDNFDSFTLNEKIYIVGFLGYSHREEHVTYLENLSTNESKLNEAINEALTELKYRIANK